jgi:hypothetical protein
MYSKMMECSVMKLVRYGIYWILQKWLDIWVFDTQAYVDR